MILATGVLCYLGMLSCTQAIPVAIVGAALGDQFWYYVGRHYHQTLLHYFPSLQKRIDALESTIQKRGKWLAFGGRFVYSGAILFPVTLGTYRFSHRTFTRYDLLGVTLWSIGGIGLGYLLGSGMEQYIGKLRSIGDLLLFLLLCVIAVKWLKHQLGEKRQKP